MEPIALYYGFQKLGDGTIRYHNIYGDNSARKCSYNACRINGSGHEIGFFSKIDFAENYFNFGEEV
jgi:hypothetical protein